jgi:electron transport complex protein RnfE
VFLSVIDALGVSLGFTVTLIILGGIREVLGMRTFFGHPVLGEGFEPMIIMLLPPGAFITLGLLLGVKNSIDRRIKERSSR